ncbi:Uncharacterised protein [Serratia proteamaculans]|jgi:hypothetical protein|uniref:hypothetical protein n=1 Tax=Serratia proteamaculans TaxID=28151 RepID=UPI00124AB107|nr:hypothetical protein [Serratia proteamaculans]KAB1496345.1 hypothetical protein F8R23_09010 [Serratia proteamaculans]CAI0971146.1 Uncharacterised protein [Serratia proteamaculans]CAI0974619.1 Uncharacterised protein [Serratia proteamaculans]
MKFDFKKLRVKIRNLLLYGLNSAKPFTAINLFFYGIIIALVFFSLVFTFLFVSDGTGEYAKYFILLAVSVTLLTLVYNIRRHVSEDYYKDAKEHLEKAFEILQPKEGDVWPPNDRYIWLTAARFLKVSERLAAKIMMTSHKDMYREERQYWRVKFRGLVKDFPAEYYAESAEKMGGWSSRDRSPLSEPSLVVIYKFLDWEKGYVDPLDNLTFTDDEIEHMRISTYRQLGGFLHDVREYRRKDK